jgi:hypothetical protein
MKPLKPWARINHSSIDISLRYFEQLINTVLCTSFAYQNVSFHIFKPCYCTMCCEQFLCHLALIVVNMQKHLIYLSNIEKLYRAFYQYRLNEKMFWIWKLLS